MTIIYVLVCLLLMFGGWKLMDLEPDRAALACVGMVAAGALVLSLAGFGPNWVLGSLLAAGTGVFMRIAIAMPR